MKTIKFENPHKHFKLDEDTENKQSQFAFLHQNHLHFHDKDGSPVRWNLLHSIYGNPGSGSVRGFTSLHYTSESKLTRSGR